MSMRSFQVEDILTIDKFNGGGKYVETLTGKITVVDGAGDEDTGLPYYVHGKGLSLWLNKMGWEKEFITVTHNGKPIPVDPSLRGDYVPDGPAGTE